MQSLDSSVKAPRMRRWRERLLLQEDLNFLLTNRVPRIALTHLMGWYSRIDSPWLTRLSIAVWRWFSALDLGEAVPQRYTSLHQCFTRALQPGRRPVAADPAFLTSPCDGIVGACGAVEGTRVFQAKGMPYDLATLLGSGEEAQRYRDGVYVTLRLTSSMYHRFHAPHDGRVEHVRYISGDTWNVNPIALARVRQLFCRNERAPLRFRLARGGAVVTLVPVAAILVASIRLHWLDVRLHLRWRGPHEIPCDAAFAKGAEMGWFEHGSTIVVFAPRGFALAEGIAPGRTLRMGQALMRLPADAAASSSGHGAAAA
jgi:phosphatidylserine decarboxylase